MSDTLQNCDRARTRIAAARPFLGLCPSPLLWLKALDALYNFPAAGKVVGGKPGARRADEVRPHDKHGKMPHKAMQDAPAARACCSRVLFPSGLATALGAASEP